jgi:hypothetical protein
MRLPLSLRPLAGGVLVLAALHAAPLGAASPTTSATQTDVDWLRQQTVRLQVERTAPGGEPTEENGSGVLLCQVDKQAYVLTANHVIFGKSRSGRLGSLLDVAKIRLTFYKDLARPVEEAQDADGERPSVFTKSVVAGKDLLLLSFEVPEDLAAFARPGAAPAAAELAASREPRKVWAVGYLQAAAESWAARPGALLQRDGGLLRHSAAIGEGFSGGPLFDEAGALIGLNIQVTETDGTIEGRTLPIDEVLPAIDKWVPASCLPRDDEERAAQARDLYREAMRHVSLRDWPRAEETLREALAKNSLEGGSVHLQGMRYTEYLPHYHLGLALARQDRCGEALRELQVSEVQGVIQDNKRFRDLRRLRQTCREKLEKKAREA